ncbi:glycoside hydrolase family 104 protein [Paraburkholderia sp. CNPSo 3076]|uniref:glycoside hydrolase family 24 protein n=1 Tax=Paraburkholderia sp. CNPSo 3076 TaxID=2940936 RepID=UPI002252B251|nr:glycoside hydrolase family 104 protein [Paraburkholderia sp. CNPSo 3076]MCX5545692.1 glycoside hydrolase family 104 protein [Paraburkholderia sp. CNPSo 3076]
MKGPGPLYLIAAATLAAAAYVWWTNSQATPADMTGDGTETDTGATGGFFTGILDSMNSGFQNAFSDPASALANSNVQAFLRMVRVGEGTSGANGYTTLFGGGQFSDMSKHPDVRVPFGSTYSTAAGAYQINYPTWLDIQAALSLPDFSAASQDIAACWLIKRAGALADVENGAVDSAISKCNKVWASLPGAPYGQPTRTLAQAETDFASYGGVQTDA